MNLRDNAQSTMEYAVLICILAAALVTMGVYFKRGMQGRLRANAQQASEDFYSPKETESAIVTNTSLYERITSNSEDNPANDDYTISTSNTSMSLNRIVDYHENVWDFKE